MRDIAPASPSFSLTVKRNCSISPQAVIGLLVITACVSFGIGAAFAWLGLWLVLPFVGLEMTALVAAFYVNGRHAGDFEQFRLEGASLVIEISEAHQRRTHSFDVSWVRLACVEARRETRLLLMQRGRELEIGRHLDAAGRRLLGQELAQAVGRELRFDSKT